MVYFSVWCGRYWMADGCARALMSSTMYVVKPGGASYMHLVLQRRFTECEPGQGDSSLVAELCTSPERYRRNPTRWVWIEEGLSQTDWTVCLMGLSHW